MLNQPVWLEAILPMMTSYSRHFKESNNLGQCSQFGPLGPLTGTVRSRMNSLTSDTAATNIIFTLSYLPLDWNFVEVLLLALPKKDGWGGLADGPRAKEVVVSL